MPKFVLKLGMCLFLMLLFGEPLRASAVEVGDVAPVFSEKSTMGKIDLSEYRGKRHVVLAFYFADFTPV